MTTDLHSRPGASGAALAYTAITLASTWPVVAGLGSTLPSDLGDPVLNAWILARNAQWLLEAAAGHATTSFWDAKIFHPEPLSLAFSEHLVVPTLQALPVYALTGNAVFAHNLLFLSSFVLSALGAFLFVRELTGHAPAAFLAGLCYGFSPYRFDQTAHLQVLSSQWAPFALLGLRRFVSSGRPAPLAGAVLALVAQGLSCGYHLAFFTPFAALYALFELHRQGRVADRRRLAGLALAGIMTAVAILPFLLPYAEIRGRGVLLRGRDEVERFSADVHSYLTAPEELRLWGRLLDTFPLPEGALFPGLVPLLLAGAAVAVSLRRAWAQGVLPAPVPPLTARRRLLVAPVLVALLAQLLASLVLLAGLADRLPILAPLAPQRSLATAVGRLVLITTALLALSPRTRRAMRSATVSETAFFLGAALLAAILSLGPTLRAHGRVVADRGPYALLYDHVPGFDAVRVPARFAMPFVLFLAVLAGRGAAAVLRARAGATVVALAFLAEVIAVPLEVHSVAPYPVLRPLLGEEAPTIYRRIAALPEGTVLAEMPIHFDAAELLAMVPSLQHRRRLVNGYSGVQPAGYLPLRPDLLAASPERAWEALEAAGATHALLDEGGWGIPNKGRRVRLSLEARGARLLAREGSKALFELRRARAQTAPVSPAP